MKPVKIEIYLSDDLPVAVIYPVGQVERHANQSYLQILQEVLAQHYVELENHPEDYDIQHCDVMCCYEYNEYDAPKNTDQMQQKVNISF